MKDLYSITNIIGTQGKPLSGWTIWVKREDYSCEYQTELYYKDDMKYWISTYPNCDWSIGVFFICK